MIALVPRRLRPFVGLLACCALLEEVQSDGDDLVTIYFGCGCFWHVQHEFIEAERRVLGRGSSDLTSLSGYAGGTKVNSKGDACYHDYGQNGHTEVVELVIPKSSIAEFAKVFWGLFSGKDRVDVMDVGPDYRAAVGLPGGMSSPFFAAIADSQEGHVAQAFELLVGAGNDRDTLGEALVWVYDTETYPFHQAELYHQFHDDFMAGGSYPQSYNDMYDDVLGSCRMLPTTCPSDHGQQPPASCGAEGNGSTTTGSSCGGRPVLGGALSSFLLLLVAGGPPRDRRT